MSESLYELDEKANAERLLPEVVTDGPCVQKMKKRMLGSGKWSESSLNKVFSTACKAVSLFPAEDFTRKMLCLGKVQSGKTAFFIATMALAMDNGYNLIYVIGGTKNNLLDQNKGRVRQEFINNNDVFVTSINKANFDDIRLKLSSGIKVVVMVLKGKSENSDRNLKRMEDMTLALKDIPSVIVDDEGDQVSPGKEKKAKKAPVIHQGIVQTISNVRRGVYLSVTATPQANLLVSTLNGISPDCCILVEPGQGYTGANTFHDTSDNALVESISDSSEFEEGVPDSFVKALYFFLVGCAIQRLNGIEDKYSMLIHPSASTKIQHAVRTKVENLLEEGIRHSISSPNAMGFDDVYNKVEETLKEFSKRMDDLPSATEVIDAMRTNLVRTNIFEVNSPSDFDEDQESFSMYKIYVGGNMLERGITLDNLCVTYIYRVAKRDNAVDTMLQRARWFGYKENYLSICKVYMPEEMKKMFIDMTNHENFLWLTMRQYLSQNSDVKKMPRVFMLETENNLILTRKSISKTVNIGGIHQGYSYDRSVWYESQDDISKNYTVWNSFFETHKGTPKTYGNFTHLVYEDYSLKKLHEEVLSKLVFPKAANKVNAYYIASLMEAVNDDLLPDRITIVKMRDGRNQHRSLTTDGHAVKELPQSYDTKTKYPGDKSVLAEKLCIQVHYVYTDKDNQNAIIPMLAINNPSDAVRVNYVTGDNEYES